MNKSELIEHIAKQADISKAAAGRALEALIGGVKTTLKKNGTVSLVGFGTFSITKRAARAGRNPRTGDTIKISLPRCPSSSLARHSETLSTDGAAKPDNPGFPGA